MVVCITDNQKRISNDGEANEMKKTDMAPCHLPIPILIPIPLYVQVTGGEATAQC